MPSQTDANTEYTLSHDVGSPTDWPSYRVRLPPVRLRLDLAPATGSHGECAILNQHSIRRTLIRTPTHPARDAPRRMGETTPRHHRLATAK
jgi:hypothetical protein